MKPPRASMDGLSPLARRIVEDVREHGPSTAEEIAERLRVHDGRFMTARAVRQSACYARGARWLDDGAEVAPISGGFLHTPARGPVRWRYITDADANANVREGRWR